MKKMLLWIAAVVVTTLTASAEINVKFQTVQNSGANETETFTLVGNVMNFVDGDGSGFQRVTILRNGMEYKTDYYVAPHAGIFWDPRLIIQRTGTYTQYIAVEMTSYSDPAGFTHEQQYPVYRTADNKLMGYLYITIAKRNY